VEGVNQAWKCTLVTVNRIVFSSYNSGVHGFTQHILVRNAHAQAFSRLLGGFSRLPAPLSSRAALARSRKSFRRRLIFIPLHSFVGLY
jgi:hypothetical protein